MKKKIMQMTVALGCAGLVFTDGGNPPHARSDNGIEWTVVGAWAGLLLLDLFSPATPSHHKYVFVPIKRISTPPSTTPSLQPGGNNNQLGVKNPSSQLSQISIRTPFSRSHVASLQPGVQKSSTQLGGLSNKPSVGILASSLQPGVQKSSTQLGGLSNKPSVGIPASSLQSGLKKSPTQEFVGLSKQSSLGALDSGASPRGRRTASLGEVKKYQHK